MSTLSRRDFLKTSATVSALAASGGFARGAQYRKTEKPNILFLNVDQLSIRAVGGYGCPDVKTPNIDRLMKSGYSFRKSYSPCPVCGPARTTWQTGRMPSEHGSSPTGR